MQIREFVEENGKYKKNIDSCVYKQQKQKHTTV